MKLVVIEPIGMEKQSLLELATSTLSSSVEIQYYDTRVTDTKTLIERGKDADIIVVSNLPISQEVLGGWEHVKLLSVAFTGIDHITLDPCRERGITICNSAGYSVSAVSDLVFGMIVSLYRNLISCNEVTRVSGTKDGLVGFELEGKKFGVIGTGDIGLRVATIARAFGCDVYAYSRTVKAVDGITYVDLGTLLSSCDIVSLHVPLTKETYHLIGKNELKKMQPHTILINTARGDVVDSQALANALNQGMIGGAGIDVFETEPPIGRDHSLLHAKNTIVTPHVAYATKESFEKRARIVLMNVAKWMDGNPQNVMR